MTTEPGRTGCASDLYVETDVARLKSLGLTEGEAMIALLVILGLSNRAIGERCCYSENTVKRYLHLVYEKLGVKNRAELTATIIRLQLQPGSEQA